MERNKKVVEVVTRGLNAGTGRKKNGAGAKEKSVEWRGTEGMEGKRYNGN